MTKILVTGATGMLGHEVVRALASDHEVIGLVRSGAETLGGLHVVRCDLRDGSLSRILDELRPAVIVNCAGAIKQRLDGWTDRDVLIVNTLVPHLLAMWCEANESRLIHVSTDCVYRGDRADPPYRESDPPDADDLYGYSK